MHNKNFQHHSQHFLPDNVRNKTNHIKQQLYFVLYKIFVQLCLVFTSNEIKLSIFLDLRNSCESLTKDTPLSCSSLLIFLFFHSVSIYVYARYCTDCKAH